MDYEFGLWTMNYGLLKLFLQDAQYFINGFFLEVGILYNHFALSTQNVTRCLEANLLELIDNPRLDGIGKFIEANVVVLGFFVNLAEDVDGVTATHAGKLDVQAALTYGE